MRTFIINKNDANQRLDKFLSKACPSLPASAMYKYIRKKSIKVNGKRAEISTRVLENDRIDLYINDDFFEKAEKKLTSNSDINVAYEDENILVANKPFGLVVHEDESGDSDTLIGRIIAYLIEKGEYNPEQESSFVPALCNRIDRNTAGLVIAAKNAEALRIMNEKIKNKEIEKSYLCIVHGTPAKQSDTLKSFMRKDSSKNQVYVYNSPVANAKTAITKYRVIDSYKKLSLLEIELITGRTHQIRAHMAHIGHPLLGDGKYGKNELNKPFKAKHQALCSYKLKFSFKDQNSLSYLNGKTIKINNAEEIIGWKH